MGKVVDMKKSAKRRVGRPPGRKAAHRPVLTLRISQELYDRLKESTALTKRSMAQEINHIASRYYALENEILALTDGWENGPVLKRSLQDEQTRAYLKVMGVLLDLNMLMRGRVMECIENSFGYEDDPPTSPSSP